LSGEFDAFDTTERPPLTAPALAAAKVAVKVTLWFAVRVRGKVNPLTEKTAPVKFACEMVSVDPPELVSVSDKFARLPTCTLPNARLVGFAEPVLFEPALFEPADRPWHPVSRNRPPAITRKVTKRRYG
jgi:hypothetical protein